MRDGISGDPVPESYPYSSATNTAANGHDFFPMVAYAIFWQESIGGEVAGNWIASTVVSPDGGHGLGQLTSSWPENWENPYANADYAVVHFMLPAYQYWRNSLQGPDLVRAIAASYNAGLGNAIAGHARGDLDKYTTDNYAARALVSYQRLLNGEQL
jgi:hypothetical protein